MLIYVLSSPDDNQLFLTANIAAVVAATKGAEEEGVVIEVGTWDTDKSSMLRIELDAEACL